MTNDLCILATDRLRRSARQSLHSIPQAAALTRFRFAQAKPFVTIGARLMFLATGARCGPVEIVSPLGTGGMDEVYRARDRKLDCDVAIRVFAEAVADDSERVARHVREARTLAAVNFARITHMYGLE